MIAPFSSTTENLAPGLHSVTSPIISMVSAIMRILLFFFFFDYTIKVKTMKPRRRVNPGKSSCLKDPNEEKG